MMTDEHKIVSSSDVMEKEIGMDNQFLTDELLFDSETRTFLGFNAYKSNVLAERDDSVVKALCYDA